MVTMTSKCEFDQQNGVLKEYLPWHSSCSQYGFSNSVNDKSHEDTDTRTYSFHVKFKILQQSGPQVLKHYFVELFLVLAL